MNNQIRQLLIQKVNNNHSIQTIEFINQIMKTTSLKNIKKPQNRQTDIQSNVKTSPQKQPQHHSLLQYYKNKVNALCQQRLAWLAKFDQCKSKLNQKHTLKQKLLQMRNCERQTNRSLIHHHVALYDQKLNVLRMERENLLNDYRDAQEVIKIGQLMEAYPQQIQKMLPCTTVNGQNNQLIKNQLNIHTSKGKKNNTSRSTKKSAPNNFNIKHSLSQKRTSVDEYGMQKRKNLTQKQQKITAQQLLQRQIVQLRQNYGTQLQGMQQLANKLQDLIKKTKQNQKNKLTKQRQIVAQINKQYKDLEKKHKALAQQYFAGRRQQKTQKDNLQKQRQQLLTKNQNLEEKVNKELKLYEKENKAKQILILKKSQDFQQNYKAKMRAKQRNLQALKQNYQKMQTICIQKVNKLEKALAKAKRRLQDAQNRKQFLVDELRNQLHTLEKKVQQQKNERQQRQLNMKIKAQRQKNRNQQIKQKSQKQQAKAQRNRLIQQSYKRTVKVNKSLSKSTSKTKPLKAQPKSKSNLRQKEISNRGSQQSDQQEEDSLEMQDLENIKRQIGELQTKIAADTR